MFRRGVGNGLAAYVWWGFAPIYFKAVASVPPLVVLAHRIVWSVVLLAVIVRARRAFPAVVAGWRDRRTMRTLLCSTLLVGANWYAFIWAVGAGRVLDASLGYFINPLMNVVLGCLVLRERLRRWQAVSVLLAASGVMYRTISFGSLPAVALFLATSFSLYGLLRKTARIESLGGLLIETTLLAPAAVLFLGWVAFAGGPWFGGGGWWMSVVLMLGGVVTSAPLLWFTKAARLLPYSTIGFLQYLAPSLQGLLAVLAFGEPFTTTHAISFGLIWAALILYSADMIFATRRVDSLKSRC